MKPPSRVRAKPDRYFNRKNDQEKRRKNRLICSAWKRSEQRNLLMGLHKQSNAAGGTSDINFAELKEKITKRSIQEVESTVEALKNHTVKVVVQQLNRQRREEKTARVPIEVWTKLSEDMAGSLDEPITAAFSQMVLICSTEPRSLKNSDPPRDDRSEVQIPTELRTIPFRPMPMPTATPNPSLVLLPKPPLHSSSTASASTSSPATTTSTCSTTPFSITSTPASTSSPATTTSTCSTMPFSITSTPASTSSPATTTSTCSTTPFSITSTPASTSIPASSPSTTLSSSSSSFSPSVSSSTPTPIPTSTSSSTSQHTTFGRRSKHAQENWPRTLGLRSIVDFEKIYSYLGSVHKPSQEQTLTPMESAVLLDLLLSLPEELSLLDCVGLEQHMIEAHAFLTSPVDPNVEGPKTANQGQAGERQDGGGEEPGVMAADAVDPPQHNGLSKIFLQTQPSQVGGGRKEDIGPHPDNQSGYKMQSTNQVEAVVETEAPGNLVTGTPCPVAMDGAGLQRAVRGCDGQAESQSASSVNTSSQSGSRSCQGTEYWQKADVCPLNPFMVPVQLLARRQAQ